MTAFLAIWSTVILTAALPLPYSDLMSMATGMLTILCAAALWFERDAPEPPLPQPLHFGHDERLAA